MRAEFDEGGARRVEYVRAGILPFSLAAYNRQ